MYKEYPNTMIGDIKVAAYPFLGLAHEVFFSHGKKRAIISIHEAPAEDYGISFRQCNELVEVLELRFSDIDDSYQDTYKDMFDKGLMTLITEDDAKRIVKFVERNIDRVEEISVHCHAGSSRSPAVCAAISKYYTGESEFWFNKEITDLNIYVYNVVLNAFEAHGRKHPNRRTEVE